MSELARIPDAYREFQSGALAHAIDSLAKRLHRHVSVHVRRMQLAMDETALAVARQFAAQHGLAFPELLTRAAPVSA